jgi:hypothetical protein
VKRDQRFPMMLSSTEKAVGLELAEADGGLSLAALFRRLLRVEAERRGLWPCSENCGRAQGQRKVIVSQKVRE